MSDNTAFLLCLHDLPLQESVELLIRRNSSSDAYRGGWNLPPNSESLWVAYYTQKLACCLHPDPPSEDLSGSFKPMFLTKQRLDLARTIYGRTS